MTFKRAYFEPQNSLFCTSKEPVLKMKQQLLKIYICSFIVKSRYNSSKKVDYFYLTFW
ncbi:hypothetical protein HMPREF0653_01701 [Prevotella disiens JCM 6334 = ATCC 29426]|uniref:Uncharacterized protein n=1 Tax=Prevotella disiens JCM 6334 = ATCC 29426 TaxID=1235811 RepID=A0ABN0NR75_9BACT|nr:hypothetical protein HMPREF0653_01701 [Prevotella disiens JCM 6334 = ATCC 29426]